MSSTCEIIRRPLQVQAVTPHQTSLAFTSVQLSGMTPSQRDRALSCLASLLTLAGGAEREANDDQC
jgi:hypothetical protein